MKKVDLARIGLAPPQCECGVLPLNYRPQTLNQCRTIPKKFQENKGSQSLDQDTASGARR